jgi:hypothetical protein
MDTLCALVLEACSNHHVTCYLLLVFAPSSSPKSWLIDGGTASGEWQDWDPKRMENSMDRLEKTVRGFGGGAKEVNVLHCLSRSFFSNFLL